MSLGLFQFIFIVILYFVLLALAALSPSFCKQWSLLPAFSSFLVGCVVVICLFVCLIHGLTTDPRLALSLGQFSYLSLTSAGIMGIDHEIQLSLLLSWHTYLFSLSLISPFISLTVIFLFSCHMYVYKIYKYVLHRKEYGRHLSFWVWLLSLNLHGGFVPCAWCSSKHGLLWDTDLEAFRYYIPRCGLLGPPGRSSLRLLRKIHADFQISYSLYSHQEGWFLSPSSSPMLVIFFLNDGHLIRGSRNLKALSIRISLRAENIAHFSQVIIGHLYFFLWEPSISLAHLLFRCFGILM